MDHNRKKTTKPTRWPVRPAKTQISLGLCPVFAVRMKKPWAVSFLVSAQRRLIRLGGWLCWSESLLGRTCHFVGFVLEFIQLVHPRINSYFFTHIHGSILHLSSSFGMFNFWLSHLFLEPVSERILCKW